MTTQNIQVTPPVRPTGSKKVSDWIRYADQLATQASMETPEVEKANDEFTRFTTTVTFHAVSGDKFDGSPRFTKSGRQVLAFVDACIHLPIGDIWVRDGKLLGALGDKKPCLLLAGRSYEAKQDIKFGKNAGTKKGETVNVDIVGAEWDTKNQIKVLLMDAMKNNGFSLQRTQREDDPEVAEADDFFASMSKAAPNTPNTSSKTNTGKVKDKAIEDAEALMNS